MTKTIDDVRADLQAKWDDLFEPYFPETRYFDAWRDGPGFWFKGLGWLFDDEPIDLPACRLALQYEAALKCGTVDDFLLWKLSHAGGAQ